MTNILVTGCNGQLGSEINALSSEYDYFFYYTDVADLDICNKNDLELYVQRNNINVVINCAAYTAVDKAEGDFELANEINHFAVKNLAEICKENQIKLIHISTDYVFDGNHFKPYTETDLTSPNSVYGETKADGEQIMIEIGPKNSIILRTSWVYSSFGNNFVKTMLRLGKEREELSVVFDQIGTPTYARDLAKVILDVIPKLDAEHVELYHFSNEGSISWYDFAQEIFSQTGLTCKVKPIESKDFPTLAARPHYSVLNKAKFKQKFSLTIPYWRDSLSRCLSLMNERK